MKAAAAFSHVSSSEALERLRRVRGLYACALFDEEGKVLASDGAHPTFVTALTGAGRQIVDTFRKPKWRDARAWETAILRFESGTLLVRRHGRAMLVLWGTTALDVTVAGASLHATLALRMLET